MSKKVKNVNRLPLTSLWYLDEGDLQATYIRDLTYQGCLSLINSEQTQFVIAAIGCPLKWLPTDETSLIWQQDVAIHFNDNVLDKSLTEYPHGYCYFASLWQLQTKQMVVLLEQQH